MFKDFVRNIPLSEMNFDDSRNLTNLKQRFNTMVQIKHGTDLNNKYDPYIPSGVFQSITKYYRVFQSKCHFLLACHRD